MAVIDTGIDPGHPVFAGHLASPSTWYDFEDEDADPTEVPTEGNGAFGHGTAVAGTILQVAPNVTILPIRALDSDGYGNSGNLARSVDWAVGHGAQIINISAVSNVDTALTTALNNAASKGVFVTLASGNEATNKMPYPASNSVKRGKLGDYGLNAGATNSDATLASFSNYGQDLEISAPGVDLATAVPGGYALASGTSFAAPVLAGTLALALGEHYIVGGKGGGNLAKQIDSTARNIDKLNAKLGKGNLGAGLLDAQAFLSSVK